MPLKLKNSGVDILKYKPRWLRILFLAIFLHGVLLVAVAENFLLPKTADESSEDLLAVQWVDDEISDAAPPPTSQASADSTFQAIELPPLEVPQIEFPPVPKTVTPLPFAQLPPEKSEPPSNPAPDENSATDEKNKLKARVKVFPKELITQLVESGAMPERISLNVDKVILSLTIGTDGKTKNIEILQGGGNDVQGNLINLMARSAASAWVFEPFLNSAGQPIEIKTELEFLPEDF